MLSCIFRASRLWLGKPVNQITKSFLPLHVKDLVDFSIDSHVSGDQKDFLRSYMYSYFHSLRYNIIIHQQLQNNSFLNIQNFFNQVQHLRVRLH